MLQAKHGNRGAVLAIRHGRSRLSPVLQAGRAGIGRDRLLCQQHEADGAGGEPFPEVEGETHVGMLGLPGGGSKQCGLEGVRLLLVPHLVAGWV